VEPAAAFGGAADGEELSGIERAADGRGPEGARDVIDAPEGRIADGFDEAAGFAGFGQPAPRFRVLAGGLKHRNPGAPQRAGTMAGEAVQDFGKLKAVERAGLHGGNDLEVYRVK